MGPLISEVLFYKPVLNVIVGKGRNKKGFVLSNDFGLTWNFISLNLYQNIKKSIQSNNTQINDLQKSNNHNNYCNLLNLNWNGMK